MKRAGFAVIVLTCAVVSAASAQERAAGAARVEVSAFPGGGTFFTKGSDGSETKFKNYALGVSGLVNFNRFIGAEAEVGGGLGVKQTLTFNGVTLADMESPNTLAYNGKNQLETATDGAGRKLTFAYNAGGQVESVKDPMGHLAKYTYESSNLATVVDDSSFDECLDDFSRVFIEDTLNT